MFESTGGFLRRTKGFFCSQCCRSGSGWIGIILADPTPFQPNVKRNYTHPRKYKYTRQNIENYDTFDADEKDKTRLQIKAKKFFFFPYS